MSVRIGISLIAWQNDDLPEMTAAHSMEEALQDSRDIGYSGVERGRRMPSDPEELRRFLAAERLALCGGWYSMNLLTNDVATEREAIRPQLDQFIALNAPCIVCCETSNAVHGQRAVPIQDRPKLTRDEIAAWGAKLSELAKWTADRGMTIAYHHHMGSIVEDPEDLAWFLEATAPEVTLCYDTGHLLFGGGDPLEALRRHGDRVHHVHFKDVRPAIMARARAERMSFLDAVLEGVFTVPGDPEGCIDFADIAQELKRMDYDGWIVVEAEQDPKKAPPRRYSQIGHDRIVEVCAAAGLAVEAAVPA